MAATDERKPISVLFADLAGSTELAARHDPEQLRALLGAFFDEMRQQIESFGGTVEKYAGDAILAVFGVPQVHEDDAERAVRAAFAMQDSLAQLNPMFEQDYGVRLAVRIGVASGEAVAASGAVREFMASGEVPNLAARLQSLGEGVTVSDATYRLLGSRLEADRLDGLSAKGFEGTITAYRARGLRAVERRDAVVAGLVSPVVGRDREVAALSACLEELGRGRGQVVSIVGEAGIGKSRLKIEQRERLPQGMRWLEGRCQSYTQNASYGPVIQILRSALNLGPGETAAIARTKLRAATRALSGSQAEQERRALAHLLAIDLGPGQTPPVAVDPRALQSQLVIATRALLQGVAERGPLIVALEDLHWADPASVELLMLLLELTDFQPIMFLVTSRPETEGDAWTFRLHAERNFGHRLTELRLTPLGLEDSQRIADNLLRVSELPEAIRATIVERAGGNPFFLEEIIRGLIEEGVLKREGDRWAALGVPEQWSIPSTLSGVLAARIDRLPGAAKALLQRAAVIGRFFGYRMLQAVSDAPAELDPALAHLLRAELIREWASLPERQYIFKHALTLEAAAASLLGEQRRELHARVARHMEETLGEAAREQAALLAHHWYEAANWEKALVHTLSAARQASAIYDRPAAVNHYWRALEILDVLPRNEERDCEHADAIVALVQLPGWPRKAGAFAEGLKHLERARSSANERGDVARLVRAEAMAGLVSGDEQLLKTAATRAERHGDALLYALASALYGINLGQRGNWDEALVQFGRAIAIYAAQGIRYQEAMNLNWGERCYSARAGRLEDSLRYAAQFREIAKELGDARLMAWRAMEAEPHLYRGAWEDATRVVEESLPFAWRIGESNVIAFASAWLALAYLKLGRLADARRVLERAVEHAEGSRESTPYSLCYLTVAVAQAYLVAGEVEAALEAARRALGYAERSRYRLEQGAAHRVLGQALAATGNRGEAEAAFGKSLEILEDIKSWPELGQTLLAYGQFKLADDPAAGRDLISRASSRFKQIGATGWLAEATALTAVM
jgi:class 3 adenylate cyclase/tetratricopeptide (TPR) repeat protein